MNFQTKAKKYSVISVAYFLLLPCFLFGNESNKIEQPRDKVSSDLTPAQVDSLTDIGIKFYRDSSALLLRSALNGLEASRKHDYRLGEAKAFLNLVIYHTLYGEKDTAVVLSEESIEIAKEINDQNLVAQNYHYKALSLQQLGKYQEALFEYSIALDLNSKLGNDLGSLKQTNNIALIYRELKDYESARKYLQKAFDLATSLNDNELKIASIANQAYVLLDQKKYEEANEILNSVLSEMNNSNQLFKSIFLVLTSQVQTGLGRFDEAIDSAIKGSVIADELNYGEGVFNANYSIANAYFEDKRYLAAIQKSEEAIKDPNSRTETRYVHKLYNILSQSYREIGNSDKALEYQDEYLRLNDKIYSEDQQTYAARLKIEYDIKERETENLILKTQSIADKNQIKNQRYIYLSTSLIALLGLGLAFLFYKTSRINKEYSARLESAINERTMELQTANIELQNSNYELERFAFIASHDLKEPLKNVISFSELIQKEVKQNSSNPRLFDYANFVERGSKRLFALVQSIFEFSRIEKDILGDAEEIDLEKLVENLKDDYGSKAEITFGELPKINGNLSLIYTVLQNLVQNGIKYNKNEKATIHIESTEDERGHIIKLTDNGIGFHSDHKEKVFDMFTRLNTKDDYEGAGLGLAICKKVMNAHKGEIWVESEQGVGSSFYLTFPSSAA